MHPPTQIQYYRLNYVALKAIVFITISSLFTSSCFWKKAQYDPLGEQYAVTVKEEALSLMEKAVNPFFQYKKAIYRLMTKVEYAFENARALKKNETITGIWNLLRDPRGNRLGKFMKKWEIEGQLDPTTIETYTKWVGKEFETICNLEEGKKK
jgi:hypothetical protein